MAIKLYYSPLACSLADHIALQETGQEFERERVDLKSKRTESGRDYNSVTTKGYVPALVLETGETLTENIAVLDWIASRHPKLGIAGPLGRTRVLEALTYVSTELHRSFLPMWHSENTEEKAKASETITNRLAFFSDGLKTDYLFGDRPSVADFYLFVMLLWAERFQILVPTSLVQLRDRIRARPAVQAAMSAEGLL